MHYHFDPVGGIAGDMFVAALLDLNPERAAAAIAATRVAGLEPGVSLEHRAFTDGILSGSRFAVSAPPATDHHGHVHWSELRSRLTDSALSPAVRDRAIEIFAHLAEAEARVHDKPIEEVGFHEVGAWDSIADIVAAAFLIEAIGPCTWSIGTIPLGSGRVRSEHGLLPVPAPATVLLLAGLPCFDDGFAGERVTPTGAAIIRHLEPAIGVGNRPRILRQCGYGFGTRTFDGMSNVLRVLEFEDAGSVATLRDAVSVIEFDVDDQTAEDLARGLDVLRATDGVIDIVQIPVVGKHGRLGTMIRILAEPAHAAAVGDGCFRETTTLGLRLQMQDRIVLKRRDVTVADAINVKIAQRPGGATAKAQLSDVAGDESHAGRERARRQAEDAALKSDRGDAKTR
jgi:uncharacterized protein (TIGR00299 family) protein